VLSTSALSGLYAGIWGVSAYLSISDDNTIARAIGTIDLMRGSLYMGVLVIELFGIFSASKQRVGYVRLYCYLSLLAALLVMTAEMMRVVSHFKYKQTVIKNCIDVVTSTSGTCSGPFCQDTPLSSQDGTDWCNDQWSNNSFGDIAWFLVASLFALFFNSVAWAYLHQLRTVGSLLAVGLGVGGAERRSRHSPDDISMDTYDPHPRYAPPPGAPPPLASEDMQSVKAPEYDGYNAGDYLGQSDKPPVYDFEATGDKGQSRTQEDAEDHGPRIQDSNNPFR